MALMKKFKKSLTFVRKIKIRIFSFGWIKFYCFEKKELLFLKNELKKLL